MRISRLICLHPDNEQISWATFNTKGQLVKSAVQVPLDSVTPQNNIPFILIPGTDVLLTQTDIPSKQQQRIIQAVPYALEEQLAEDVEDLHFALGKREPLSGNITVAVIARAKMDAYLQQLKAVGITTMVFIPDILAIPKPSDGWGILYLDDIVLIRTGLYAGFAIEPHCLGEALHSALLEHENNPPQQITVFSGAEPITTLTDLHALGIPITEETHPKGILAWFAQGLIETKPLNLLQGDYRPQDKMVKLLRPWRLTAILLLLWGGLLMAEQWIEYYRLSQQRQLLNAQIEKIYRGAFPKARKIVNPRVQMEQKLTALRAQQGSSAPNEKFLSTLTKISTHLARTPAFNLKRLDYRQGKFDIQLTVANLQALEHLKHRLTNLGFTVEIQSATSRNTKVESRLRIE